MMIWILLLASLALAAAKTAVEPEYLDRLLAEGKDEEFAKLMNIDVSLVRPKHGRSEGSMMTKVSPLGDILLSPELEEDQEARQGIDFDKYTGSRWPNDEIPYVISSSYTPEQKEVIQGAIDEFNSKVSNVQLVKRRGWWFGQRDYVMVFSGDGCYSYLGRVGGQQPLSLQANGCVYKGTVQHEFMHAAGFTHEQNRYDRDEYIKLLPENIPPQWQSQYEKVSDEDFNIQGPYDYYSIMHYPVEAPQSGGKPAFEVLKSDIEESRIGNGDTLTQIDVDKLNALYNKN